MRTWACHPKILTMRHFFRQIFFYQPPGSSENEPYISPFTAISRHGIKVLLWTALILIALGVLILIYPLILAVFVAALFFLLALGCLSFAWRLWRAGRLRPPSNPDIHVEIHSPPRDDY